MKIGWINFLTQPESRLNRARAFKRQFDHAQSVFRSQATIPAEVKKISGLPLDSLRQRVKILCMDTVWAN
jgi:hypothetical protein